MANTSGRANETNDSSSNEQIGGASNSLVNGDSKPHIEPSETEGKDANPGRTPGKAEGVEDAEERGNQ